MAKNGNTAAVGGSSLLVMFSVLCLVVFALLGVSSVQADIRLSEASAAAVTAYYEADCRAEWILAELRRGETPVGVERSGNRFYFECSVSETQKLIVEGMLDGADYEILRWQTVSLTDWEGESGNELWDGTM